jgi:CRISPR/Cas system-associated endoribonuclease Cas2
MVYLITYDLNSPRGRNSYSNIAAAIRRASDGNWCKPLESTWLIESTLTYTQIRDRLLPYVDSDDHLLVVNMTQAAWHGLATKDSSWVRTNLK